MSNSDVVASEAPNVDDVNSEGTPADAAGDETAPEKKKPKQKHIDMLLENPSFAPKFDVAYGEGAAEEILKAAGITVGNPQAEADTHKKDKKPSEKHIKMLLENPSFATKFDVAYGTGAADAILQEQTLAADQTQEDAEEVKSFIHHHPYLMLHPHVAGRRGPSCWSFRCYLW